MNDTTRRITSRYASLPLLSGLLRVCGYLAFLFGIFQAVLILWRGGSPLSMASHVSPALQSIFWGVVRALELLIIAEGIHVLLDIEQNTRRSAEAAVGVPTGHTPRRES